MKCSVLRCQRAVRSNRLDALFFIAIPVQFSQVIQHQQKTKSACSVQPLLCSWEREPSNLHQAVHLTFFKHLALSFTKFCFFHHSQTISFFLDLYLLAFVLTSSFPHLYFIFSRVFFSTFSPNLFCPSIFVPNNLHYNFYSNMSDAIFSWICLYLYQIVFGFFSQTCFPHLFPWFLSFSRIFFHGRDVREEGRGHTKSFFPAITVRDTADEDCRGGGGGQTRLCQDRSSLLHWGVGSRFFMPTHPPKND